VTGPDRTDPLERLARLNVTAVFLATLALVLVGMFAPGVVGGAVLLALAAALAALLARTWPVQSPRTRAFRLTMLVLLLAAALAKIF
jgi:multisubunit Na+/H+ antiporter MnhB subunit